MIFFLFLLFSLIDVVISSALIPRRISNASRSKFQHCFPLKSEKMFAFNPKRMSSNKTITVKITANRNDFTDAVKTLGFSLYTILTTIYILSDEDTFLFGDAKMRARCFEAISKSNVRDFEKFCISESFDINSRDKDGVTAMEVAIKHGRSRFILPLLLAGAHKNGRDSQGHCYLQTAIESGNEMVLGELLFRGFDVHAIGQLGRDHFQRAIETGNVEMIRSWIFAGMDANGYDSNNRHYILTAILSRQRGSFDALLDTKFKRPWDHQTRDIVKCIIEESLKATPEEARKMNYPGIFARLYVQCKCDHEMYDFLKSNGLANKDLNFLKRIEPLSCHKP